MAQLRIWLRGLGGAASQAADPPGSPALVRLLAGYPANRPHHPGDMAMLTEAERDDNLAQLLRERDDRLGVVGAFLRRQGVDPAPMLDPLGDGVAAARRVDRWLDAVLPRRTPTLVGGDPQPNPDWVAFRRSDRASSDLLYSLLADLALLEGEAMRRRDDRFSWVVNRRKAFRDMASFGRICLTKAGARGWEATVIDVPEHLLAICHAKARPGHDAHRGGHGHFYGELLDRAVRRGFDPP